MKSMKTTMMIFMAVILSMSVSAQTDVDDILKSGITLAELQTVLVKADSLAKSNVKTEVNLLIVKKEGRVKYIEMPNADTSEYESIKITQYKCAYEFVYGYVPSRKTSFVRATRITTDADNVTILIFPKPTFYDNISKLIAKNN